MNNPSWTQISHMPMWKRSAYITGAITLGFLLTAFGAALYLEERFTGDRSSK